MIGGTCDIGGVTSLTEQQQVRLQLPHQHGGMGLRRFSEDVATAACLSSAAITHKPRVGDLTRRRLSEAQWG